MKDTEELEPQGYVRIQFKGTGSMDIHYSEHDKLCEDWKAGKIIGEYLDRYGDECLIDLREVATIARATRKGIDFYHEVQDAYKRAYPE